MTTPLRVCCYGSSSCDTPEAYLAAAHQLGLTLAQRGHTCVNGAGSFGCMAALNEGAAEGDGAIVGVIHEMWMVDNWSAKGLRDGGAHPVFQGDHDKREILVAGGPDLQERKKLLVQGADALIVLPGGPGTWDELWEMACARGIGLSHLPIVCVNVDGYYEPFRQILERAYREKLTKHAPHELVHLEDTAEAAIDWIERECAKNIAKKPTLQKRSDLGRSSFLHTPMGEEGALRRSIRALTDSLSFHDEEGSPRWIYGAALFAGGIGFGVAIGHSLKRST